MYNFINKSESKYYEQHKTAFLGKDVWTFSST